MMKTNASIATLALLFASAASPTSQQAPQHPLPSWATCHYAGHDAWAGAFHLPTAPDDDVHCFVRPVNSASAQGGAQKRITIRYLARAGADGQTVVETIDYQTSYVPTAVCSLAGTTDRLFVAGWAERDGVLVVEEWTLEGHLVGTSATSGAGGTATSFAPPTVRRNTRLQSAPGEYAPITDLVVLPVDDRLLALTRTPAGDPPLVFVDIDAESLAPAPFAATGIADIEIAHHTTAGVLLTLHESAPWVVFAPHADTIRVHRDAHLDGTFESFETLSYDDFYLLYPVSDFDLGYSF